MRPKSVLRWLSHQAATHAGVFTHPFRSNFAVKAPKLLSLLSTGAWAFVAFLFIYLLLIRYLSHAYYGDPTSAFFDPKRGYERSYSLQRQEQADAFIEGANDSSRSLINPKHPRMCIGIPSVSRNEAQYVRSTVGSLLEGLSDEERKEIYLTILVAHTAPQMHPIKNEAWLKVLSDRVLLYDVSQKQFDDLMTWEKDKDYRKKGLFDYTYTMRSCLDTGAEWITMIEDDTLAVAGWYPRAIAALEIADDQHRAGERSDWLYLRLFFTEEFLGWNSEEWPRYLAGSVGVIGSNILLLLLIRQFIFRQDITNTVIAVGSLICTPLLIILYFLAGRLSMQPFAPGVYRMPKFGCCAQGLVFSREMAPQVIDRLEKVKEGFVDQLIETWANEAGLVRWVVMPSLLQHLGGKSSKGDDFGAAAKYDRSVAEKIWSFGFELYDSGD